MRAPGFEEETGVVGDGGLIPRPSDLLGAEDHASPISCYLPPFFLTVCRIAARPLQWGLREPVCSAKSSGPGGLQYGDIFFCDFRDFPSAGEGLF